MNRATTGSAKCSCLIHGAFLHFKGFPIFWANLLIKPVFQVLYFILDTKIRMSYNLYTIMGKSMLLNKVREIILKETRKGNRLTEDKIAKQLGISRTPVREIGI